MVRPYQQAGEKKRCELIVIRNYKLSDTLLVCDKSFKKSKHCPVDVVSLVTL